MIAKKPVILGLLFIFHFSLLAQNPKRKFLYGVTGHPLTQEAYIKNINSQINLLKGLNCKFYRFDVPTDSNGNVANAYKFLQLIKTFKTQAITILPVLVFDKSSYTNKPLNECYKNGLVYGMNFAKLYKNYFDYYEIGNEEDNNIILPQVHGNIIAHYDTTKSKSIMNYFKGVCEAIKKEDRSAKLIVNHSWVHWGFLQLLEQYKVDYDIIGCHWYSEMGDLQNANSNFGDITASLFKKFRKRLWVTEINIKNGSLMGMKQIDTAWLRRNLNFMRYNKYIDAIFIYELLDQPALANKKSPYYNLSESNYGLATSRGGDINPQKKSLFIQYKSFISHNP